MTEDEMVGWPHQLDGHEFKQAPGLGDGQGDLACCSPWDCKELTSLTNSTELGKRPGHIYSSANYSFIIHTPTEAKPFLNSNQHPLHFKVFRSD